MKNQPAILRRLFAACLFVSLSIPMASSPAQTTDVDASAVLKKSKKLFKQGNYREAYQLSTGLLFNPAAAGASAPEVVAELMESAHQSLHQLNYSENSLDEFLNKSVEVHPNNWRVLELAADRLIENGGYGSMLDGKFQRNRWDGQRATSADRDRILSLQWQQKAVDLVLKDPAASATQRSDLLTKAGDRWLLGRQTWQLQSLTDLSQLPEVELEEGGRGRPRWQNYANHPGYPVDAAGKPVFFKVPANWEAAANDGERWRFLLDRAMLTDPNGAAAIQLSLAQQFSQWLDVSTLQGSSIWDRLGENAENGTQLKQSILNLATLAENETITRFATGIQRHTLPVEFDYLGMLKEIAGQNNNTAASALALRAGLFENRRQLDKAAACWQELKERFGNIKQYREQAEARLTQIRGNLGKLSSGEPQPAGQAANVSLIFRNANKVELQAFRVDVDKLVGYMKTEMRERAKGKAVSNRTEWSWLHQAFGTILQGNIDIKKGRVNDFVSKEASAKWSQDLEPAEKHADRRITLETPLRDAGIYLVEARFADGNVTRTLVELVDLVTITKPRKGMAGQIGFVLDAVSGKPVANASVDVFGYRQEYQDNRNKPRVVWFTSEQTLRSDESGSFVLTMDDKDGHNYQWLVQVTTPDGRKNWIGLHHYYGGYLRDKIEEQEQEKLFVVSDRPVYRPAQEVHLSAWARRATYEEGKSGNEYAGKKFTCEIEDPQGQEVFSKEGMLNEHGAANLSFTLGENATLGDYQISWSVQNMDITGGLSFGVEEYKKPEFEVLVKTPDKPVLLGEAFTATVEAKYYFGGAVTKAKVHYKVERTIHRTNWFPVRPWDWLYGPGYWWRNSEYNWLPGYRSCISIWPPWWGQRSDPPEVIADATVPIGPDGKVQIPIDSALAKELHSDQDHRYSITAEVVDSSRRMIVGSGSVIAPRQPYQVYVWMDRGFYQAGAEARAFVTARTPDGKTLPGKALLRVMSVHYDAGAEKPVETEVGRFELTAKEGEQNVTQSLQFPNAGQYRLAVEFKDEADHSVEGIANTVVRGPDFDGKDLRFPELEVVAEKEQYATGEKANLAIHTNNEGGTVLVFERPVEGSYGKPKVISIADGKSTTHTVSINSVDQPNIFVEVMTVHNAKVHSKILQIPVPPTKRVAEVELTPSSETYLPQTEGNVQVRITDPSGTPIQGQVLLTGYDKAIEYISGGSNIPAVRDFFWGWKRNHQPVTLSSLQQLGTYYDHEGLQWRQVGMFGGDTILTQSSSRARSAPGGGRGIGGVAESAPVPMMMAAPASPAAAGMERMAKADFAAGGAADASADGGESSEATPMIRQEFADLLVWNASAQTNAEGIATVPFKTPDDLTTWKLRAWVLGPNSEVGEAEVEIISRKNLLVRMQAPRFFVEKDEVVLSGIVHNDLKEKQNVRAVLELDGKTLGAVEGTSLEQRFEILSGGEHRFDWRVKVLEEGEAKIRIKALAAVESDAVEKTFPVLVHGMERQDAWSLAIRPDQAEGGLTFTVPDKRRPAQTRLEVRYSPSLAAAMVDALPFLISYPHGCTEQTLNRFVPTVITQKVLNDLGLDLKAIRDKRANLNAQELGDPKLRAAQWKKWKDQDAVFDAAEMTKMVNAGIERLQSMQAGDGGWGWWPGAQQGSLHLTAQVVEGLLQAKSSGVEVPDGMIEQGLQWLQRHEAEELRCLRLPAGAPDHKSDPDHGDAYAHAVLVAGGKGDAGMRKELFEARLQLSKSMQARLGLACHMVNEMERRDMIIRNLEQFQKSDAENQTAWLDFGNNHRWWYWFDDEIETLAAYLQLRVIKDAKDPVAPALVKYLLNNRKNGTYWRSTRDTASALQAIAAYIKATGETDVDMLVEIWVDGKKVKEAPINKENLFTYDHSLVLSGSELSSGDHRVEIKRKGKGALYANVYLCCFTLEDHLRAAGLEVKVQRELYKLVPEDTQDLVAGAHGQALNQKGQRYKRERLPDDASLISGDLIEVELIVDSKNDYEYLMLEDYKPAGCEAVDLQSGYVWSQGLNAYREFRDEKVTHYLENLPRGKQSLTYRLRAEIPGKFSALPSVITGMYAPELKGNSEERKVGIADAEK